MMIRFQKIKQLNPQILTSFIIYRQFLMIQEQGYIQYRHNQQWHNAKCDQCLHSIIGDFADIQWNIHTGKMKIYQSESHHPSYEKKDGIEYIKHAHYCHGKNCPFLNEAYIKNPQKDIKPCAVVLLRQKQNNQLLVTRRAKKMSFPGAWVLPGGHLQKGQGIFEGGIRQCQEQVGLPETEREIEISKSGNVMIWESVFTMDDRIRSSGLVVFFMTECKKFEVKMLESQVIDYKWKSLSETEDEVPYCREKEDGYAEGHLKYLQILRGEL